MKNSFDWERLMYSSSPHPQFNQDWSSYEQSDFVSTFLPFARTYSGKSLLVSDGAELFVNIHSIGEKQFSLADQQNIQLSVFSFTKGSKVGEQQHKLLISADSLLCFAEMDEEDNVELSFRFGSGARELFGKEFSDTISIEGDMFQTNRTEFKQFFRNELSHKNLMQFFLKTANIPFDTEDAEDAEDLDDSEISDEAMFDAGQIHFDNNPAYAHGDIERIALKNAGFSGLEIQQTYLGNWLRDYSSVIVAPALGFSRDDWDILKSNENFKDQHVVEDKLSFFKSLLPLPTYHAWCRIVYLLAVKEFVYDRKRNPSENFWKHYNQFNKRFGVITENMIGLYRPEEHMDNPRGLKDESILGNYIMWKGRFLEDGVGLTKPVRTYYEYKKGEYKWLPLYPGLGYHEPLDRYPANMTGNKPDLMKPYIKSGLKDFRDFKNPKSNRPDKARGTSLQFLSEQLRLAAGYGRNKDGLRHFGAAMHVFEDFFAHSNYVEVLLIKYGKHDVYPWVESDAITTAKAKLKAKKIGVRDYIKTIPIVTGTFGFSDTIASMAPKIADQFFPKGIKPYKNVKAGDRTFTDRMITIFLEDLVDKEKNIDNQDKTRLSFLEWTYEEALKRYEFYLLMRDERYSSWAYKNLPNTDWLLHWINEFTTYFSDIIFNELIGGIKDVVKLLQGISPHDEDPTHTQLAKDNANHPLNPIAGYLATIGVEDMARMMNSCWKGDIKVDALIYNVKTKYFTHPYHNNWAMKHLKSWLSKHKKAGYKAVLASEKEPISSGHHHAHHPQPKNRKVRKVDDNILSLEKKFNEFGDGIKEAVKEKFNPKPKF